LICGFFLPGLLALSTTGATPLESLVATERTFAARSLERGMRAAFLDFFADDGINFQPHPVNTREALRLREQPPDVARFDLDWAPHWGTVAHSGDLGFTTGPYLLRRHEPGSASGSHGLFFSVWRHQPNAGWRVVLDMGVPTPQAVAGLDEPFRSAGIGLYARDASSPKRGESAARVRQLEQGLLEAKGVRHATRLYRRHLHADARSYRPGEMPRIGAHEILAALRSSYEFRNGSLIHVEVSQAQDLAYAYSMLIPSAEQRAADKRTGYIARVWVRTEPNRWRILLEVSS
jgi:ketosteroid isomerase-like protein